MSGFEALLAAEAAATATTAATTAAATAAAAETAAAAYASAVPGLAAVGPGSQAAMLAAQTAPFGAGGLASTAAAGAIPGTLSAGYWNTMSSLLNPAAPSGGNLARMGLQAAQLGPAGGQRSSYSPSPMNRGREVTLAEPVQSLLQTQPMPRRKPTLSLLG
jgi:hypothetical protein